MKKYNLRPLFTDLFIVADISASFKQQHEIDSVFDLLPDELVLSIGTIVARLTASEWSSDGPSFVSPDLLKFRSICKRFAALGGDVYVKCCQQAPKLYRTLRLPPANLSLSDVEKVLWDTNGTSKIPSLFASIIEHVELRLISTATRPDLNHAIIEEASRYGEPDQQSLAKTVSNNVGAFENLSQQHVKFLDDVSSAQGQSQLQNILLSVCKDVKLLSIQNIDPWSIQNIDSWSILNIDPWYASMSASLSRDRRAQAISWNFLPNVLPLLRSLEVEQFHGTVNTGSLHALNLTALTSCFSTSALASNLRSFELSIQPDTYVSLKHREIRKNANHFSDPSDVISTVISCMPSLETLSLSLTGAECENSLWMKIFAVRQLSTIRRLSLSRFQAADERLITFLKKHTGSLTTVRLDNCKMTSLEHTLSLLKTLRNDLSLDNVQIARLQLQRARRESVPQELQHILHSYRKRGEFAIKSVCSSHIVDYVRGLSIEQCYEDAYQHDQEAREFEKRFHAL